MEKKPVVTDEVQGFFLKKSGIRGRIVRLGAGVDAIIKRHAYPPVIAALLSETMALTVALAYALKYEGIFTLQTKGDGPVSLLVADIAKGGRMRGYALFDEEKLAHAGVGSALLLGKGHLAFTVDQGEAMDRYQGIVELRGRDMAACVNSYFKQSEQIETAFKVLLGQDAEGAWQAGVIMLQRLPHGGGYAANNNEAFGAPSAEDYAEDWNRTHMLMNTMGEAEMFDSALPLETLITRLFHEEEVEIGESFELRDQCRCSRPRVAMVLSTLPKDEIAEMLLEGKITVTCEFCSTKYEFDEAQLNQVEAGPGLRE